MRAASSDDNSVTDVFFYRMAFLLTRQNRLHNSLGYKNYIKTKGRVSEDKLIRITRG